MKASITTLQKLVADLRERNQKLRKENIRLRAYVARLEQFSIVSVPCGRGMKLIGIMRMRKNLRIGKEAA